jgi:hypothetical protein
MAQQQDGMDRHLEEFRSKGGGSRQRILRVLGGKLKRNGTPFHKERLQFEDEQEGPQTVDLVRTGTCSFGHTIDDKVRVAGICEIDGEVLCSTEGCLLRCVHCGAVVCRRHSRTYAERTYCRRHRWVHFWRKFWGVD